MDRWHFLDAQLWMRKVAASAWASTSATDTEECAQASPPKSLLLLPPQSSSNAAPDAATTMATAWCCFHVGSRYCFFRAGDAGEDQTQFQLELMLRKAFKEYQLLARFDGKYVYAVDLRQVVDIILPKPAPTSDAPVTQQQQQEAPPFGCLEFQNVSMRIWMDPQHATYPSARQMLQSALVRVQQCALKVREQPVRPPGSHSSNQSSWRDAFRHSEWLVDRKTTGSSIMNAVPAALQTTPSEFLKQARRILKKDADFEAVKVTCWKIVRASSQSSSHRRRRRKRTDGEDAQTNGNGNRGSDDGDDEDNTSQRESKFSEMDLILLLTELAHIFGEEHDGVNELLGFSASGAACAAHDRCYDLRRERAENESSSSSSKTNAACVTSKWQAWDEYLEVSAQAANDNSSRPTGDGTKTVETKNAQIHAAAAVFQNAVASEEETAAGLYRSEMQRDQILSFECMGFNAFFPDRSKRRKQERPVAATDARRLQQQMKAEQMFAVLLEKRKQLVRDELALSLLPHRAQSQS